MALRSSVPAGSDSLQQRRRQRGVHGEGGDHLQVAHRWLVPLLSPTLGSRPPQAPPPAATHPAFSSSSSSSSAPPSDVAALSPPPGWSRPEGFGRTSTPSEPFAPTLPARGAAREQSAAIGHSNNSSTSSAASGALAGATRRPL
eukprot:19305-Chlamydomonas_euryale.AAC.3